MGNLNGEGSGDIFDHVLRLNASEYLPTDDTYQQAIIFAFGVK